MAPLPRFSHNSDVVDIKSDFASNYFQWSAGPKITEEQERAEWHALSADEKLSLEREIFGCPKNDGEENGLGLQQSIKVKGFGVSLQEHVSTHKYASSAPGRESPEQVKEILAKLRDAIIKLGEERSILPYLEAEKRPRFLDDDFKMMFVRWADYKIEDAARRMAAYWETRLLLFGDEKAFLPLTLEGAMRDDIEALAIGAVQILPEKDEFGRTVMLYDAAKRSSKVTCRESVCRMAFYMYQTAAQDKDVQRDGIVIFWKTTAEQINRKLTSRCTSVIANRLPIKIRALHYCYGDKASDEILPFVKFSIGPYLRQRLCVHSATTNLIDSLADYGIPSRCVPIPMGGALEFHYLSWLEAQPGGKEALASRGPTDSKPTFGEDEQQEPDPCHVAPSLSGLNHGFTGFIPLDKTRSDSLTITKHILASASQVQSDWSSPPTITTEQEAAEWAAFSDAEKASIRDDVKDPAFLHGGGSSTVETEHSLTVDDLVKLCQDVNSELDSILALEGDGSNGYSAAKERCPRLLNDQHVILFLQWSGFQPKKAAERMVAYWDYRTAAFGLENAFLPISYGFAMAQDQEAQRQNCLALIPGRVDDYGRGLAYFDTSRLAKDPCTRESMIRAIWCVLEECIADRNVQKNGMVLLWLADTTSTCMDRKLIKFVFDCIATALPVKVRAIHFCCSSGDGEHASATLPILKHFLGLELRHRFVCHCCGGQSLLDSLQTFGIPRQVVPTQLGGYAQVAQK